MKQYLWLLVFDIDGELIYVIQFKLPVGFFVRLFSFLWLYLSEVWKIKEPSHVCYAMLSDKPYSYGWNRV
jgi:hypothetical protein